MANTANIVEVTFAEISNRDTQVNDAAQFGEFSGATKLTRSDVYKPMIVRVTDHPEDDGSTGNVVEGFALYCSMRHGEPWMRTGHQTDHLIHSGAAVIADTQPYSVIYPNYDYPANFV